MPKVISYNSLDEKGSKTLETLDHADRYNLWYSDKFRPFLGKRNLEIGSGQGTISKILIDKYSLWLSDLSEFNLKLLKKNFKNHPNILGITQDIFKIKRTNFFDCIFSSNVLEHIKKDDEVILHCLKMLKVGGNFVAIVPAMPFLYSDFDKKIGHYRRYGKLDKIRIQKKIKSAKINAEIIDYRFINPLGAIGWFLKMKLLNQGKIKKEDAWIMNKLVPVLRAIDLISLNFGQSILLVIKKC